MAHDYENYPELTNKQLDVEQFNSPHQQITEDFRATVVKVHDGDTIRLQTSFRDFDFPLRLLDIDAPELNEGGEVAGDWLRNRILNQEVQIMINKRNRVDKYGRLLGHVMHRGMSAGQEMLMLGLVKPFIARHEGEIPDLKKIFAVKQWF